MPLYEYKCEQGNHNVECRFRMSDVPPTVLCATHQAECKRFYSPQNVYRFQEDRLRMWKGPMHNGYSTALGCQMPETRKEAERIAEQKGLEFVSPSAMPPEWVDAVDYRKHVDTGGERLQTAADFQVDYSAFKPGDTRPESMK